MLPTRILLAGAFAAAALLSPATAEDLVAITGATVVDGTGAAPRKADVLIRGGRIAGVGAGLSIPPGARVIAAAGQTLLPGLFDVHTHLPYAAAGRLSADWGKNLKAYLYCGVTSVADFGTYSETFEPMRRLLGNGTIAGPRLTLASRISTPGGHGAESGRPDIFSLEVLTPREGRAAVKRLLPARPNAIKVFTDGWRYGTAPDMTSMEEAALAAIVEEAHRNGLPVLTHTVTLEKAKIAARAGVDVIAHGVGNAPADEELFRLMKQHNTFYAPTLAVYEPRTARLDPLLAQVLEPFARPAEAPAPATASAARRGKWKVLLDNTAALRAAGVPFCAGTDAGMPGTFHGWATLRELALLVEGGLTPLEALAAATGNSARALRTKDRGTIAEGKLADLLLVEGEPHRRIEDIQKVRHVFLGGREIDRERLAREIAAPAQTPIPALRAAALIDDFEGAGGRSRLATLWVNGTDSGHDRSRMSFARTLRARGNHALSLLARMAEKDRPFARVTVPLSRGGIEPVDARAFKGIRFDARGEGEYRLVVTTRAVRNGDHFQSPFRADGRWKTIAVPFTALRRTQEGGWTGDDLLSLSFEVSRPAGENAWLELDNVRFYK